MDEYPCSSHGLVGGGEVQQFGPEGSPGSRYVFFEHPDGSWWAVQAVKRTW